MKKIFLHKPGERVFAVASGKDGVLEVYGAGVYEGDFPYLDTASTEPMSPEAMMKHDMAVVDRGGSMHNPRIKLDNGKYVWGCECWWGPEEVIRKQYEGYKFVEVDIDVLRQESGGGGVPSMLVVTPEEAARWKREKEEP